MESATDSDSSESQDMVFTCSDVQGRRLQGSEFIGALGVDYNGMSLSQPQEGLVVDAWVFLTWIAYYNESDGTSDICSHIDGNANTFTIPSAPFVQAPDTPIEFCAGCNAFVQTIDWSNEPIHQSEIIEMQYNPIVVIDLEQPVCPIG